MHTHQQIISYLQNLADPVIAKQSQRYFKTGQGEYGQGDSFIGLRVPTLRKAVKLFLVTPLQQIKYLVKSESHEVRLFALLLLVKQFANGSEDEKSAIFNLYISHTQYINNWDLVDSSAHYIVGQWLFDKDRALLYQFAQSDLLWRRRIAVMATFYFIKKRQFDDTLRLADILLNDREDLIHKAVGWMLREIANRDLEAAENHLKPRYNRMPRTMLRYAIEKFPTPLRLAYLKGQV